MRCPYCGAEVSVNKNPVCEYCDSDLSQFILPPEPDRGRFGESHAQQINRGYYEAKPQGKSKQTALLLCCLGLLGIGGIHRLYVGKIGSGLLYFFTYGLFWFGTFIDLILIATDNFTDRDGNRLV